MKGSPSSMPQALIQKKQRRHELTADFQRGTPEINAPPQLLVAPDFFEQRVGAGVDVEFGDGLLALPCLLQIFKVHCLLLSVDPRVVGECDSVLRQYSFPKCRAPPPSPDNSSHRDA